MKGAKKERGERRKEIWRGLRERSATLTILLAVIPGVMLGQTKEKPAGAVKDAVPARVTGSPTYAALCINNISAWMRADGQSNHAPSGNDGMVFPRGTGPVVYQDGLIWGGKVFSDPMLTKPHAMQPIRVGGAHYSVSTNPGRVVGSGASAVREDPSSANVRIYRIRRGIMGSWYDFDLQRDAAAVYELPEANVTSAQMQAVRTQYHQDWMEWPVQNGAPFIDRNGNGVYDAIVGGMTPQTYFPFNNDPWVGPVFTVDSIIARGLDEPGVAGADMSMPADQVIWTVYNDLDPTRSMSFAGSEPIGLEVQKTMWAYRRNSSLDNMYFTRFRIINKGGIDTSSALGDQKGSFWVDSMYVGHWSDPDIGQAGNDLAGCDIDRDLGYAYNDAGGDATFQQFNLAPPVVGYHLLAGPNVPSPGDSAYLNFRYVGDRQNLHMSSFAVWGAGDPYSSPPSIPYITSTGRWWKILRGYAPLGDMNTADIPYVSGPYDKPWFRYHGDPVAGTGFIDGLGTSWSITSGDRQIMPTTGPFRLAPGDTQEVAWAVIGSSSADRLTAITVLRSYVRELRSLIARNFTQPTAPAPPIVRAVSLDRAIVLEWGSDAAAVERTEQPVITGTHAFEGYVVYQRPEASSPRTEYVRLATYDRVNGIMQVAEEVVDPYTGIPNWIVRQEGKDSGIRRSIVVEYDMSVDTYPTQRLINGREYYFAVTAYNVSSLRNDVPVTLESSPVFISIKPQVPFGQVAATAVGETLSVAHTSGRADMRVVPLIVDPLSGRGDSFRVTFQPSGPLVRWTVENRTRGTAVVSGQSNLSGDDAYPIVDGALIKVIGFSGQGLKPGAWDTEGTTRIMTWTNGDGMRLEEFNGAAGWMAPAQYFGIAAERPVPASALSKVSIRFARHTAASPSSFNTAVDDTSSYAYRYVRSAFAAPAQPSFTPWIVNTGGGYRFQDYRISVPMAVYDVDVNPPQRLAVAYLESNNTNGLVDGYYWPPYFNSIPAGSDNTNSNGPREWLFILKAPYTGSTPNGTWQDLLYDGSIPVMYTLTWTRRTADPWVPPITMTFTPLRSADSTDAFDFVIPAPAQGRAVELASVQRLGVFPNPYYADPLLVAPGYSSRLRQYVTFNNLPQRATVRVFNLAGHLVRTLRKDDASQFLEWNLQNEDGWLVASGMYLCHVELTDLGVSKVLKLGIVAADAGQR